MVLALLSARVPFHSGVVVAVAVVVMFLSLVQGQGQGRLWFWDGHSKFGQLCGHQLDPVGNKL
jgi:hypothetical protein